MNPSDEFVDNNTMMTDMSIKIWVEARGRKKNTYITGWDIPDEKVKEHIKNIKKKVGCSGEIKDKEDPKTLEVIKIIHFQGDVVTEFVKYITNLGIDSKSIYILG